MAASRPPLFLRVLIGASLAGAIAPAGFALWSLRDWAAHWAGRPLAERRAAYTQVPWLRAPFPELAASLRAVLPADAGVLIEPVTDPGASPRTTLSPPRWHVFLTHYVYPVRFYVRAPALSCVGFHHEAWLDHHFEELDLDGSAGGPHETGLDELLAQRGITWRLRMPVRGAGPEFFGLDRLENGVWVEVPLPPASREETALSALITALCLWLTGHALVAASGIGARRRPRGPLELHATALLLGAAALALAAFYAVWWLGPLEPRAGFALMLVPAIPGALVAARHHQAAVARRGDVPRWSGRERLAGALLAAFALFAVFAAASAPTHGFDATFHFVYKAQLLFHEGFATPAWTDVEGAVGRSMEHPTYPPFLPALELLVAWVRTATTGGGFDDDDAARPLMALFALLPLALLLAALQSRGRGVALVAGLAWITLPILYYWRLPHPDPLLGWLGLFLGPEAGAARFGTEQAWTRPPNWCLDGTADLPLAAFFLAAFLHATRLARGQGDRLDALAAGLSLAAVLTLKNEGLALAAVLALGLAAGALGARRGVPGASAARALLGPALVAALASGGWFIARASLPNVDENYPARLTPGGIADSLGRAGDVAARFAHTLVDATMWNLTWPLFAAVSCWALARRRVTWGTPPCAALLVIAGAMLAYALVLLVTPWDLALLESTGIPMRLLLHLAPLAVFATFALAFTPRPVEPQQGR